MTELLNLDQGIIYTSNVKDVDNTVDSQADNPPDFLDPSSLASAFDWSYQEFDFQTQSIRRFITSVLSCSIFSYLESLHNFINEYESLYSQVNLTASSYYESYLEDYLENCLHSPSYPAEYFYASHVAKVEGVKAIVLEKSGDSEHFITVLSVRDFGVREEIYNIEMKMFDIYEGKEFAFSIMTLPEDRDIDSFISGKNLLYYNR